MSVLVTTSPQFSSFLHTEKVKGVFSWSFNPVATRWHYNKDISIIIIILSVDLKTETLELDTGKSLWQCSRARI